MLLTQQVPPQLLDGALTIVRRLQAAGYEAYFAGGAVRDLILGKRIQEIDVATSAPPERVEALFEKTIPVGRQFGVVVVVVGDHDYEVATFREEADYTDGRHPGRVRFSDAQRDVLRRDFTINALLMDPLEEGIIDYVDGQADLERRIIRAVGSPEIRFQEDKLRILRALRLACQLDFHIDGDTYQQIQRFVGELGQVSWERIRDELIKILTGPDPARGLRLLLESGVLAVVLPEVAAMQGVSQPAEFHPEGDVMAHVCLMFKLARAPDPPLALAILLHDVGKPPTFTVRERIRFDGHVELGAKMAEEIGRRLRLPNQMNAEVVDLVSHHMRFMHVQKMRESTLKRFLRKVNFDKHLELHRLDCAASHGDLENYHYCRQQLEKFTLEALKPAPLIDGHDLIGLELEPGPLFSEILGAVEDRQLEGHLADREEALAWVREKYTSGANET